MPAVRDDEEDEITVRIEYNDHLNRFDLDELLTSIDYTIADVLSEAGLLVAPTTARRSYHRLRFFGGYIFPGFIDVDDDAFGAMPFFGIRSFDAGSLLLTGIVSGAVATKVFNRFMRGFRKSKVESEIERLGNVSGTLLSTIISRLNKWGEDYVEDQRATHGNVTSVTVTKTRRKKSAPPGSAAPSAPPSDDA